MTVDIFIDLLANARQFTAISADASFKMSFR
jgi:hypothetical protein